MNFKVLALTIVAFLLAMGTAGVAVADWPGPYEYEDDLFDQPWPYNCSDCHSDIAENYSKSLHYTYRGIENEWMKGSIDDFDLPNVPGGCMKCHVHGEESELMDTRNCTSCHIEDWEDMHDGSLADPEDIEGDPEYEMTMEDNCKHCHKKRPGVNFVGKLELFEDPEEYSEVTTADIHYSKYNFVCWDCHSSDELHGMDPAARDAPNQRLAAQVRCEDCHDNSTMADNGLTIYNGSTLEPTQFGTDIRAHDIHDGKLDCSACHAEWYQHCAGTCHLDAKFEGTGDPVKTPEDFDMVSRFYLGKGFEGEWVPFYNMTVAYGDQYATHWVERSPHTINKTHDCDFCHGNDEVLYAGDKDDKVMITGGALLSVGGITIPINVVELVLPYIVGSLMLVVPIAGVIVAARRRK